MNDEFGDNEERQLGGSFSQAEKAGRKTPIFWICVLVVVSSLFFLPGFLLLVFLILAPIIAIIAKIRIALYDGRVRGCGAFNWLIGVSTPLILLTFLMPFVGTIERRTNQTVIELMFKDAGSAIHSYADKHGGELPTADLWCDVLILEEDLGPNSYRGRRSYCKEGESCYALNKYAVGKKLSELPGDMVLLYETNLGMSDDKRIFPLEGRGYIKQDPYLLPKTIDRYIPKVYEHRWNQVGGPEDMSSEHSNVVYVLFVNGEVKASPKKASELEDLRWDEGNTQYNFSDYSTIVKSLEGIEPHIVYVIALVAVICITGFVIIVVTRVWKYSLFALPLAIGATMVGFVLGGMGEWFYSPMYYRGFGTFGSAILAFVAGLCYVGIVMTFQERLKNNKSVGQLCVSVGMAVGVICSTVLHLGLLLIHQNNPLGIIMGLPFGIVGGAILGYISDVVISGFYRKKDPVVENVECVG